MVHALNEIHRTLKPGAVLLDIRPLESRWPVEISSAVQVTEIGHLIDLPSNIAADEAAARAVHEAEAQGWFTRVKEVHFPFFYYWDTPSEMKEFMDTEWEGLEKLDGQVLEAARSAWAVGNADARLRVGVSMLITRWEKR